MAFPELSAVLYAVVVVQLAKTKHFHSTFISSYFDSSTSSPLTLTIITAFVLHIYLFFAMSLCLDSSFSLPLNVCFFLSLFPFLLLHSFYSSSLFSLSLLLPLPLYPRPFSPSYSHASRHILFFCIMAGAQHSTYFRGRFFLHL